MQFDPRSQIDIIIPNKDANDTMVKFMLRGISVGIPIITPIYEEMDTIPVYEITRPLFWYPSINMIA